MNPQFKRWLPFGGLVAIIIFTTVYLLGSQQPSAYLPQTENPAVIYKQACSGCHGARGEGTGLFYPALHEETFTAKEIERKIREGALFMPAFRHINGDTLKVLVRWVKDKQFSKR